MGFIDSFFAVLLKVEPAWQNIRFFWRHALSAATGKFDFIFVRK